MMLNCRGLDRLWIIADHALLSIHHCYTKEKQNLSSPQSLNHDISCSWMRVNHSGEVCAQSLFLAAMIFARNDENFNIFSSLMRQELKHLSWCKKRLEQLKCPPSSFNPILAVACFAMASVAGAHGDNMAWSFIEETEVLVIRHLRESYRALDPIDPISAHVVKKMIADETHHATTAHHHHVSPTSRTGFLPYMRFFFSILKQVVH